MEREEEISLIKSARTGDKSACEELFYSNTKFVKSCWRMMSYSRTDFDEWQQLAFFAMWEAMKTYDVERGYRFCTYWKYFLMQEYYCYRRKMSYPVAVTRSEWAALQQVGDVSETIVTRLVSGHCVKEDVVIYDELCKTVWQLVEEILDEKNAFIIIALFREGWSMVEIASTLGIKPQSVAKRRDRSILKLRQNKALEVIYEVMYLQEGLL